MSKPIEDETARAEYEAMHPARREVLDRIMADFPSLDLATALEHFKAGGG